jgi:superoxide dismutase, Cu-Zn family
VRVSTGFLPNLVWGQERMRFCHLLAGVMTIGLAAGTTLALDLAVRTWTWPVWAQEAQRVSITVAPLIRAAPEAKTPLSIQVGAQNLLPKDCFIRVRGLPPFVALSDGHAIGSGSWSVPLPAGPGLVIFVPTGTQEKSEVVIDVLNSDGSVFAEARTELAIASVAPVHGQHRNVLSAGPARPDLDPSPLGAIRKGFEAFLAQRTPAAAQKDGPKSSLTSDQYDEMFRQFLTWPQNPLEVHVNVRLTSVSGVGEVIGTLTVKNSEIVVAGRKEGALFLKPNLRGLRPGLYAFHVHENPNCEPALKDGEFVPGLAAGSHLWLSGTGELSGTTFTSHLGNLPHLEVDGDGTATKVVIAARLTLADVANRSIIIHASHDDFSPRLACGRLN